MDLSRSISEGSAPARYVVHVSVRSGFSDRLVGSISAFYYALLTNRYNLMISRSAFHAVGYLEDIFGRSSRYSLCSCKFLHAITCKRDAYGHCLLFSFLHVHECRAIIFWQGPNEDLERFDHAYGQPNVDWRPQRDYSQFLGQVPEGQYVHGDTGGYDWQHVDLVNGRDRDIFEKDDLRGHALDVSLLFMTIQRLVTLSAGTDRYLSVYT